MSMHNIVGREQAGAHVVIRHIKQPRRRTFLDVVLSAIGGATIIAVMSIVFWTGIAWPS